MVRRILLALSMVVALTAFAVPVANAGPGTAAQCPTNGGVKVSAADSPATISVTDTATNSGVSVVVTITGSEFAITAPGAATYTLSTASWCVKSALSKTNPSPGDGLTGISPSIKKNVAQDIGYVLVYSVTTAVTRPCLDSPAGYRDLLKTGPINVADNAEFHFSSDGSCAGAPYSVRVSLVSATDMTAAEASCDALGDATWRPAFNVAELYDGAPSDWYACYIH